MKNSIFNVVENGLMTDWAIAASLPASVLGHGWASRLSDLLEEVGVHSENPVAEFNWAKLREYCEDNGEWASAHLAPDIVGNASRLSDGSAGRYAWEVFRDYSGNKPSTGEITLRLRVHRQGHGVVCCMDIPVCDGNVGEVTVTMHGPMAARHWEAARYIGRNMVGLDAWRKAMRSLADKSRPYAEDYLDEENGQAHTVALLLEREA